MNDTHTTKRKVSPSCNVSPSFGLRYTWNGYSPENLFHYPETWMTYGINELDVEVNDGSGWRRPVSDASVEDIMEYIDARGYAIPRPANTERTPDGRMRYEFRFTATPIAASRGFQS